MSIPGREMHLRDYLSVQSNTVYLSLAAAM